MKKVILRSISLSYFKGIKNLTVDFSAGENYVFGKNEAGKTTLFDSIWFLFFGKDSTGRADFSIKTFDSENRVIEKVDHEVLAVFEINGQPREFKRVYKELWNKSSNELKGHTTEYWVDGYPVRTESEYKAMISELFSEDFFKLLTNPLFFNSMKPADRREVLLSLAPQLTNEEIFESIPAKEKKGEGFKKLEQLLSKGVKLEQIRQKAALDKRNLAAEKEAIPARIDEAMRSKPEVYNFEELEEIISEKRGELREIEAQIEASNNTAASKNKQVQVWQEKIFELKGTLSKLEFQAEQALEKAKREEGKQAFEIQDKIKSLNSKAADISKEISLKDSKINSILEDQKQTALDFERAKQAKAELVDKWKQENAKTFHWDGETCQACQRPFEGVQAADREEQARARFNSEKAQKIRDIEEKGAAAKSKIERLETQFKEAEKRVEVLRKEKSELEISLDEVKTDLLNLESALNEFYGTPKRAFEISDFLSPEAVTIQKQIESLEAQKPEEIKPDNSDLIQSKQAAQNAIEELSRSLGNKATIERIEARISELKETEKRLADEIADLDGLEFACLTYSKVRIGLIESAINSKFSLVRFKMFKLQLNGEEVEVCDTLLNGVPFPDLNTAGKIQAGLDIIKALSEFHGLYLPIFIDNRESVHRIPALKTQVINLIAKEGQETLEVKKGKEFEAEIAA